MKNFFAKIISVGKVNLSDKKTTVIGLAFVIAFLVSAGVISQEEIQVFMDNLNQYIVLVSGIFLVGFTGKNSKK